MLETSQPSHNSHNLLDGNGLKEDVTVATTHNVVEGVAS